MLILSRRPGDAILIDGGIRIVVLASDNRGVRIGIEAPSSIGIVREEVVLEIADENRRANAASRAHDWITTAPPPPESPTPTPPDAAAPTDHLHDRPGHQDPES